MKINKVESKGFVNQIIIDAYDMAKFDLAVRPVIGTIRNDIAEYKKNHGEANAIRWYHFKDEETAVLFAFVSNIQKMFEIEGMDRSPEKYDAFEDIYRNIEPSK